MDYDILNDKLWIGQTKLICDENFKNLLINCMREPDFNKIFPTKDNYSYYWSALDIFMKQHYNSKSDKSDKFIFLLLLTYPINYIKNLRCFTQLKISFNEICSNGISDNSDFTCRGFHYVEDGANYCICSQYIQNVFVFENNLSGISFNVGSVCNQRYKVIDQNDETYKLMKQAKSDRDYERKYGLDEGTKSLQRKNKKINKENTNTNNIIQNDIEINLKNKYSLSKICYLCNKSTNFIHQSREVLNICSNCCSFKRNKQQYNLINDFKQTYKFGTCNVCNNETKLTSSNMCNHCILHFHIKRCVGCSNNFTTKINTNINYCNECSKNIKYCKECNTLFLTELKYKDKCYDCYLNYINNSQNFEYKDCEICNNEFEYLKHESWRNRCNHCFKKYNNYICTMCNNKVKIFKVKKEGKNKNKLFYKCDQCSNYEFV